MTPHEGGVSSIHLQGICQQGLPGQCGTWGKLLVLHFNVGLLPRGGPGMEPFAPPPSAIFFLLLPFGFFAFQPTLERALIFGLSVHSYTNIEQGDGVAEEDLRCPSNVSGHLPLRLRSRLPLLLSFVDVSSQLPRPPFSPPLSNSREPSSAGLMPPARCEWMGWKSDQFFKK